MNPIKIIKTLLLRVIFGIVAMVAIGFIILMARSSGDGPKVVKKETLTLQVKLDGRWYPNTKAKIKHLSDGVIQIETHGFGHESGTSMKTIYLIASSSGRGGYTSTYNGYVGPHTPGDLASEGGVINWRKRTAGGYEATVVTHEGLRREIRFM